MNKDNLATISALIERDFNGDLAHRNIGEKISYEYTVAGNDQPQRTTLEIVDSLTYQNDFGECVKAIAFRDSAGNLQVHFNGTGDGNWGANAVAYGGGPSQMQPSCLDFFDRVVETQYYTEGGNLYVSGHSMGGNNAQVVTMNSEYGDHVRVCLAMDAPGFSGDAIERMQAFRGESWYEAQRQKIHTYNGASDYVDVLGMEIIAPQDPEHLTVLQTPDSGMMSWHTITGILDGNRLTPVVEDYTPFHYFVEKLSQKFVDHPDISDADQQQVADLVMKVAEYFIGNDSGWVSDLTGEDVSNLLKQVLPLMAELFREDPTLCRDALKMLGLSEEMVGLVEKICLEFDELSETQRGAVAEALGECLTFSEDGTVGFSGDILSVLTALMAALPVIKETCSDNPEEIIAVLDQMGLGDAITNFIKEHPLQTIALGALAVVIGPKVVAVLGKGLKVVTLASYACDAILHAVETVQNMAAAVRKFFVNTLQAVKQTIANLKEYLRSSSPGVRYAASQPWFRADPELLRDYARRLGDLNRRLGQLDGDLNDLYWQVGLLDILDILDANIITGYSLRLASAKSWLEYAADTLDTAEQNAQALMGG